MNVKCILWYIFWVFNTFSLYFCQTKCVFNNKILEVRQMNGLSVAVTIYLYYTYDTLNLAARTSILKLKLLNLNH